MDNCTNCKFIIYKKTSKSKIDYGFCKKLKINMISIQTECEWHKIKKDKK